MRSAKTSLYVALVMTVVGGTAALMDRAASTAVAAEVAGDHWANFDGHWSYWHEGDKRWYYTDGKHWYYHSAAGWALYNFDKLFGSTGFHRGDYVAPDRAKVELPTHRVIERR